MGHLAGSCDASLLGFAAGPNRHPSPRAPGVRSVAVLTDPAVGDYHRMLLPGSYELRFTADGYRPVELAVTVPAQDAVRADVVFARR